MKQFEKRENERTILDRALSGDESAYSELMHMYQSKVAATVYSILGKDYVDEISQEAFVRAFTSIKSYRRDSSFYTYLIRITVNLCRDEIRKKKIRKFFTFTEAFSSESKGDDANDATEQFSGEYDSNPATLYDSDETLVVIREEMEKLPAGLRTAITLRDIDELSYKEISKMLKITVGTAKTRVFRARQLLREQLTRRLGHEW
ncbi:MAG: RNA polymerase sigma factor [Candidatus Kryptoniota bacterium]